MFKLERMSDSKCSSTCGKTIREMFVVGVFCQYTPVYLLHLFTLMHLSHHICCVVKDWESDLHVKKWKMLKVLLLPFANGQKVLIVLNGWNLTCCNVSGAH